MDSAIAPYGRSAAAERVDSSSFLSDIPATPGPRPTMTLRLRYQEALESRLARGHKEDAVCPFCPSSFDRAVMAWRRSVSELTMGEPVLHFSVQMCFASKHDSQLTQVPWNPCPSLFILLSCVILKQHC